MKKLKFAIFFCLSVFSVAVFAQNIEPNWESMAKNYDVPEWFQDGMIGIWFHYGISAAIDENRPNDCLNSNPIGQIVS